jgi:hypothetical protein
MALMRRLVLLLLLMAAVAAACGNTEKPEASRAFCTAADNFNREIERATKQGKADPQRQAPLVEEIARTAPRKISGDAATFADAMRRRADGDTSVVDDPDIQDAAENVNRFANQACNVYQRDSGI